MPGTVADTSGVAGVFPFGAGVAPVKPHPSPLGLSPHLLDWGRRAEKSCIRLSCLTWGGGKDLVEEDSNGSTPIPGQSTPCLRYETLTE